MGEKENLVKFPATESGPVDLGWGSVLLPEGLEIDAQCIKIEIHEFKQWNQRKRKLTFRVVHPVEYSFFPEEKDKKHPRPVLLDLWVREELAWKKPPMRSTLRKVLFAAQSGRPSPGVVRITPKMFLKKGFVCKVKTVEKSEVRYSEIEEILSPL